MDQVRLHAAHQSGQVPPRAQVPNWPQGAYQRRDLKHADPVASRLIKQITLLADSQIELIVLRKVFDQLNDMCLRARFFGPCYGVKYPPSHRAANFVLIQSRAVRSGPGIIVNVSS